MNLRLIARVALGALLTGCGGSSSPGDETAPSEVKASSAKDGMHDAFVCRRESTAIDDGITMFAFDEHAFVDEKHTRPDYCEVALRSGGRPILSYFCSVSATDTAETTDGQQALLFTKFLGDGLELLTQYNLPKNFRDEKGGKGRIRLLGRRPKDLRQPIASNEEHVECKLESVEFPH